MFKKIIKFLKRNKYKELSEQLTERIEKLEGRIFEKKESKTKDFMGMYYSTFVDWGLGWEPETLEKEIDILQDKLEALCKHFKVELVETKEKEKEWVVKKLIK